MPSQGILDPGELPISVGGHTPPLYAYTLLIPIGVTVSGYFVDFKGVEIPGSFISYAGTGNPVTFYALYTATAAQGTTPWPTPTTAQLGTTDVVGFVGAPPSGTIYVGLGGNIDGSIKTGCTPTTSYPQQTSSSNFLAGRVA